MQLKVGLADLKLRTWARDDLTLPVFPAAYAVAEKFETVMKVSGGALQVHAGPHRDTAAIALVARDAIVKVTAKAGEWLKIALSDTWSGWVPALGLSPSSEAPTGEGITRIYAYDPPTVVFDDEVITRLHTDQKRWSLTGLARFSGSGEDRRYVVIFRDSDKVFFRSARPDEGNRTDLPFSADIALESGRNVLRIVAREGEDDVTGRTVIVYRR